MITRIDRSSGAARALAAALLALVLAVPALGATGEGGGGRQETQYAQWIEAMKENPRGPFVAIKWFCKDGRVLPPKDFACAGKGQGWQHGEWSERTRELRAKGYRVATLLAGVDAGKWIADPGFPDDFAQLLVERFLVAADGGWIYRKAQFYRGAIQEEDEREGARVLLTALAGRDEWIGMRYPALRIAVRLLPHGADSASAQKVRNLAAALSDRDPAFERLRVKIHGTPEAADAASVRAYAASARDPALRKDAEALAVRSIACTPLVRWRRSWRRTRRRSPASRRCRSGCGRPAKPMRRIAPRSIATRRPPRCSRTCARRCRASRPRPRGCACWTSRSRSRRRTSAPPPSCAMPPPPPRAATKCFGCARRWRRASALATSTSGSGSRCTGRSSRSIATRCRWPTTCASSATWGWCRDGARRRCASTSARRWLRWPPSSRWRRPLRPGPAARQPAVLLLAGARPALARRERLAGMQHKLLGKDIGAGFNALNPGLARGVLRAAPDMKRVDAFRPDGIYVLPEIGRRPAAARRHPDHRGGQSAVARPVARAQPRHPQRCGRRVACSPRCGATTAGPSCSR